MTKPEKRTETKINDENIEDFLKLKKEFWKKRSIEFLNKLIKEAKQKKKYYFILRNIYLREIKGNTEVTIPLNATELSKHTGISVQSIHLILNLMRNSQLLEAVRRGRCLHFYVPKTEDYLINWKVVEKEVFNEESEKNA